MEINEKRQLCKACATGNQKHQHNQDPNTCVEGRNEYLRGLKPEVQLKEMIVFERLSPEMADYIWRLSKERKKMPLDILTEEGLLL